MELKPCPMCKGEPAEEQKMTRNNGSGGTSVWARIYCSKCGFTFPTCHYPLDAAWNAMHRPDEVVTRKPTKPEPMAFMTSFLYYDKLIRAGADTVQKLRARTKRPTSTIRRVLKEATDIGLIKRQLTNQSGDRVEFRYMPIRKNRL